MAVQYNDILSILKIKKMYNNIRSNTCHKEKLVRFELAFTSNVINIFTLLKTRSYKHSHYNVFLIAEPKYRVIMSEIMRDKIVNHLVSHYVLIPSLDKKLIEANVATRKNKGTKMGVYYFKKYVNSLKENHDDIYVLKCDISKYFYNIDHQILLDKLAKDIEDKELYSLVEDIVRSTDKQNVNDQIDRLVEREISRLKGKKVSNSDKLISQLRFLPHYNVGKGLPIGNETSQILAIYYLNDLDHFIKEKLKIKGYVRYMDDFLLFHHDKEYLKYCLKEIEKKIKELKLQLNKKTQIYNMHHGVVFLGYKFVLKNKRLIVLINNQTKKRVERKLRKMKKRGAPNYELVKASYNGYFKTAHTKEFLYKLKW